MTTRSVLTLLISLGFMLPAWAGQPPEPGKPAKLASPTNVTCTTAGDQLTVSWEAVPGAAAYRVHLERGEEDVMEVVAGPPYALAASDIGESQDLVTAKVRAMAQPKGGKGASKPSDAVACQ